MRITFGHLVCLFGCFCGLAGCGIFGEDKLGGMTVRDAFKDPLVAEMVEAASSGRLSVVDAKIKAGANVNYMGTDGITPLLWVIPMNHHAHDFSGVRRLKRGPIPTTRILELRHLRCISRPAAIYPVYWNWYLNLEATPIWWGRATRRP